MLFRSTAGNFGPVNGKTYREILQRIMNTIAWGQIDSGCNGQGGWTYNLVSSGCTTADGSTIGWNMMALLFTVVLVLITLSGSLWVMHNLNTYMMPMQMTPEAAKQLP